MCFQEILEIVLKQLVIWMQGFFVKTIISAVFLKIGVMDEIRDRSSESFFGSDVMNSAS
jgi:hypothetical protein